MPAFSGQSRRCRQHHHHILAGSMYGISPEQLRAFIHVNENDENTDDSNLDSKRHRVLALDCRSFVAYNNGHIVDSVNVHCPAILRRRCGGRLPLRTLIPNSNIRTSLTNSQCFPVVLYDDYGLNAKNLGDLTGEESTAAFVAKCLRNETDLKTIYYLEGGYQNFSRLYPDLVTQTPCHQSPCPSPCQSPRPLSGGGGGPVEILSHLYLGSARDAARKEQLQQLGVTALLNVTQMCPNLFQEAFLYKCIPVRDTGAEDIAAHFHEAIHFIDQVKAQNGKVLVHCQAGISRSATICIAYLMATKRLRMEEAYKYVKSRRKIVSPNFSFMGQLLSFENQIFSSSGSSRYHLPSPGSPLLAVDASTPDPDSLTPSSSASQRNVFDFRPMTSPAEDTVAPSSAVSENEYVTASIVDPCHKLSLSPCLT